MGKRKRRKESNDTDLASSLPGNFVTKWEQVPHLDFKKTFNFLPQKPKHPTTGIIAITLAFHICHEVHLAGFKYNFSDLKSPLHYYGNATMSVMNKVIDVCVCNLWFLRVGKLFSLFSPYHFTEGRAFERLRA